MKPRWHPLLVVAALMLLTAVAAPARAQNPCETGGYDQPGGGIGGTGMVPGAGGVGGTGRDEPGIGGTGRGPGESGLGGTGRNEPGIGGTGRDASGIAGTGRDEPGIGGTGRGPGESGIGGTGYARAIFGTVTGYASMCVAGIEVHYDAATTMSANSETRIPAIGEIVEVLAEGEGQSVRAVSITSRPAAVGQVETIDAERRTMRVLGQTVLFDAETRSRTKDASDSDVATASIEAGEMVAVSGLRRADGSVIAARIDRTRADTVGLTGVVSRASSSELVVSSVVVDVSALKVALPKKGEQASVRGRVVEGRLVATELDAPFASLAARGVKHLDVEGYVGKDGRTVSVGALRIEAPRSAAVAGDARVRVSVSVEAGSRFTVEHVRPAIAPRPMHADQRHDLNSPDHKRPGGVQPGHAGKLQAPPPGAHPDAPGVRPPDRPEHPGRWDRPERPDFPDRPPPRHGGGDGPMRPARPERPQRLDTPEPPERPSLPERVDLPARPPDRIELPGMR